MLSLDRLTRGDLRRADPYDETLAHRPDVFNAVVGEITRPDQTGFATGRKVDVTPKRAATASPSACTPTVSVAL